MNVIILIVHYVTVQKLSAFAATAGRTRDGQTGVWRCHRVLLRQLDKWLADVDVHIVLAVCDVGCGGAYISIRAR